MINLNNLKPRRFQVADNICLWFPLSAPANTLLLIGLRATGAAIHLLEPDFHTTARSGSDDPLGLTIDEVGFEVDFSKARSQGTSEQYGTIRIGEQGAQLLCEVTDAHGKSAKWVSLKEEDPVGSAVSPDQSECVYLDSWQIISPANLTSTANVLVVRDANGCRRAF